MHECVKLLLKYRKEAGIDDKNPYIFALPHRSVSNGKVVYIHVSATSLMRQYSEECGATSSKSLRATILRKHVATKSMSLKLDNEDLHLLQGYLGHAEKIHREYYRQPVLERDIISVSKVLLAAQCSPTSGNDSDGCRSTPMSLPTAPVPGTSTISSTPTTPLYYSPTSGPSKMTRITTMEKESGPECNSSCDGSNFSDDSDSGKVPDGKRRRLIAFSPGQAAVKRTWNTPERQAARKHFSRHLLEGTLPSNYEILAGVSKCEDLRKRTVPQIKMWISNNMKTKTKRTWYTPTRHLVRTLFKEFIQGETSIYPSQTYIQEVINTNEDLRHLTPRRVRSQIQQQKKKYYLSRNNK
ncbi:uncharacterized protein isoform X1 [Leptinotarsa decemlineata]|uniref:uncharacterized protein isoform X1 n=1 Tax=Leptinotarsa decemlineata TaxID=7539 RepID=UPI003D305710